MQKLEEFRLLNERVKAGIATEEEARRWQALKGELIQAVQTETPANLRAVAK